MTGTITAAAPAAPPAVSARRKARARDRRPRARRPGASARYGIYFDKVDIEKLVQTVSDATCKTFILPENVRGKISIIGPENGKVEVDADAVLRRVPRRARREQPGRLPARPFLKIVDKQRGQAVPRSRPSWTPTSRTPPTSRW